MSDPASVSYTHLDVYKRQDYYRERMKIFCGSSSEDDEEMAESLIRFIEGALQVQPG